MRGLAGMYICARRITNLNKKTMYFKLTFYAISLCTSLFCIVRWKRSRSPFAGNELVLVPLLLFLFVLVPGEAAICTMRLSLHSSLFGAYIFWNTMLKKGRQPEVPLFVYTAVAVFVYEGAMRLAGLGEKAVMIGYIFLCALLWSAFYVYSYFLRERHPDVKNTISINKLVEKVALQAPFVVLSGVSMAILVLYELSDTYVYICMLLFLLLHIFHLCRDKPVFMETKQPDEMNLLKKRGYAGNRAYQGGQLLEDEGKTAAEEGIVEDARIIHSLMVLFEREKLFMNVDIKIANVALMIGTNKTYLSRALNTRLSKNFCQFVNFYRVREVCSLFMKNPESDIRELAEQCGFNSSSNFSIVFKYNTGFTPGDWCRMVKMKLENNETLSVDDYIL